MRGRMLVLAGALTIGPACDSPESSDRGSETHWLSACDSDDACGASLKCICGICTLPCARTGDCTSLAVTATCAPSSVVETICPGSTHRRSLCLASCDVSGGCNQGQTCVDGACSPRRPPNADAGTPRVPDGGDASTKDAGRGTARPDATTSADAGADAGPKGGPARADGSALHSDGGVPTDAASDVGGANCRPGYHVISTGECNPILFADDFESATLSGDWQLWRRTYVGTRGRIQVTDGPPRSGFNYGAAGNGRGASIATHIDDANWTDYRLDFDAEVLPAGSYDPYGLLSCTRRFDVFFRVEQQFESWNQPETAYGISVQTKSCDQDVQGTVSLGSTHGYYCPGIGWGCSTAGESRGLHTLVTPAIIDGPNHYTIEVVGNRIHFWINDTAVFDYTDDVVPYPAGTSPVTRGGISLNWIWELLGWADNVVVTDMR